MQNIEFVFPMLLLSLFAGAVQAMTPDRWLPLSVYSWQKSWGKLKSVSLNFCALGVHVLLGFWLYAALSPLWKIVPQQYLFEFGTALTLFFLMARISLFSKLTDIHRLGSREKSVVVSVLTQLGPAEALIPFLIKSKLLGIGYVVPTSAFLVGTFMMGSFLVLVSRSLWNRPGLLVSGIRFSTSIISWAPATATLLLSIGLSARF